MPRIIQTNPDGSPVSNYLTQSARGRPFQTGVVRRYPSGLYIGYSGTVSFDVSASATYPLMDFQLDRDVVFNGQFCWDADQLIANNLGMLISIDGTTAIRTVFSADYRGADSIPKFKLFVPANKVCDIQLLNPDALTNLVRANVTLIGNEI
tara:strand:- start:647 stop:1099 length:453 start_codon:yes stop_codon:yes gene_type:complete